MKAQNLYLAQKYAKAFDSCAKNTQEAASNFLCYQKALKGLEQIKDIIENPAIAFNVKRPLLDKVLGQDIGARFISLLVEEKRFSLASAIERELLSLLDKRQNLARVEITSVLPLDNAEQKQIGQVLSKYFKTSLNLSFKEDKNILGGIIVKKEDLCIDGSILGRLKNLEQALKR
ncbi:MAG: ATP synthase F1 subunit delta [Elusimicrobiaceae bacterium]|nr:ATP synthase F1 subunit delta [Elusimicrobiaceae bacterium]